MTKSAQQDKKCVQRRRVLANERQEDAEVASREARQVQPANVAENVENEQLSQTHQRHEEAKVASSEARQVLPTNVA